MSCCFPQSFGCWKAISQCAQSDDEIQIIPDFFPKANNASVAEHILAAILLLLLVTLISQVFSTIQMVIFCWHLKLLTCEIQNVWVHCDKNM